MQCAIAIKFGRTSHATSMSTSLAFRAHADPSSSCVLCMKTKGKGEYLDLSDVVLFFFIIVIVIFINGFCKKKKKLLISSFFCFFFLVKSNFFIIVFFFYLQDF
ncbi:hypothetical protein NC652_029587 [Populus alba x Populus x berolinensis]|nr:hypothetical protein NC652_029587 [Populus alba x Populus x berolinensis]